MGDYDYPGHWTGHTRQNPYKFVFLDGEYVAKVGFTKDGQTEHFLVEIPDLEFVLNLDQSKISETARILQGGFQVPIYELDDRFVPTWRYDNGGVAVGTGKNKKSLTHTILNLNSKFRPRISGTDPLDYRRRNFNSPADSVPIEWSMPLNQTVVDEIGDPTQAIIIQTFPGPVDPRVCPYWLVELNGQRFYRMQSLRGHIFYFDIADKHIVLNELDLTKSPTWNKGTIGKREKEAYITRRVSVPGQPSRRSLHHLILGLAWDEAGEEESVDHRNWNKWDNRRINLRLASQSEQLKNRTKLVFKKGRNSSQNTTSTAKRQKVQ